MRNVAGLSLVMLLGGALTAIAAVGTGYSLFGQASYISPGNNSNRAVKLIADSGASPAVYSGIDLNIPANLTINDLNALSTDYKFDASSCGLGSPRFGIQLDGVSGTIFVYIGPPPNYTGCPAGVWTNTGNLLTPASLVDTSQLPGGKFYDPWSDAQSRYSGKTVTEVFLVSDNSPTGKQTVSIDNTNVNGTVYDYEFASKDDCKKQGWRDFTFAPGPFKNQGQCVSYFARTK